MALADEALAHFLVLVSFVATFGKANPCQFIHRVQAQHEILKGPNLLGVQKVLEKLDDALRLLDPDLRVVEEIKGTG